MRYLGQGELKHKKRSKTRAPELGEEKGVYMGFIYRLGKVWGIRHSVGEECKRDTPLPRCTPFDAVSLTSGSLSVARPLAVTLRRLLFGNYIKAKLKKERYL